jgi:hypothetical protein
MAHIGTPLVGASDMAERMRAFDWTSTPIGHVESWPTSLRTVARVLLQSARAGFAEHLVKPVDVDQLRTVLDGMHDVPEGV